MERGTAAPHVLKRRMSIVVKRSTISATAELLLRTTRTQHSTEQLWWFPLLYIPQTIIIAQMMSTGRRNDYRRCRASELAVSCVTFCTPGQVSSSLYQTQPSTPVYRFMVFVASVCSLERQNSSAAGKSIIICSLYRKIGQPHRSYSSRLMKFAFSVFRV